jgi:hypothetical protein
MFSWMGAATEGGYLGSDCHAFGSAIDSGAAGSYVLQMQTDFFSQRQHQCDSLQDSM